MEGLQAGAAEMPSPAKRCISGLKSTVHLRLLLDRVGLAVPVLPFGLGRLVVPFRGRCGGRCAQPVVPWCRPVVAPSWGRVFVVFRSAMFFGRFFRFCSVLYFFGSFLEVNRNIKINKINTKRHNNKLPS